MGSVPVSSGLAKRVLFRSLRAGRPRLDCLPDRHSVTGQSMWRHLVETLDELELNTLVGGCSSPKILIVLNG
jgi:hypothetical protein